MRHESQPNVERIQVPERQAPIPRHLLYIPGLTVTHRDINHTVRTKFEEKWGRDNVTLLNSAVSTDPRDPGRLQQMDDTIVGHAEGGLDIVLGSLGVTEFWKAMKRINKKHPGFFDRDEVKKNTRFVLIGPSGFSKGVKEKVRYAKYQLSGINQEDEKGREALSVFPPTDTEVPSEQLTHMLAPYSNRSEGFTMLPDTEINLNREGNFTDQELDTLAALNNELFAAVTDGDQNTFDIHMRKRGRAIMRGGELEAPMRLAHHGIANPDELTQMQMLKHAGLLIRAGGKYPMLEFQKLLEKGFDITFVIPLYDVAVTVDKAVEFFGDIDTAQAHTRIVPIGTHPSFHVQSESFGIEPGPQK